MAKINTILLTCLQIISLALALVFSSAHAKIIDDQHSNLKVVKVAVTNIPYSFSPYASTPLSEQFGHLFFDPLIRWGKDKKIEYRLLAKIKKLKNGKYRFYLKKKIYFHSGNLLTSKDVIWSFNQALNRQEFKAKLQSKVKMRRVNNSQFDIESKLTEMQLLDYLTHLFILDSAYYKKNKIAHNTAQVALPPPIKMLPLSGTGPYRVASFYTGVNLRVEASPNYWQSQPMFKSLNFVKIKSKDSRLYALLSDDIDISEAISSKNVNSIHVLDNKKIHKTTHYNGLFLTINDSNNDTFARGTARNAIHMAINQHGILKHILHEAGDVNMQFEVPMQVTKEPIYDVKRAKYLLKKIKAPKKLSLLVMVDPNAYTDEVVPALTHMLRKVGLQLEITEVDSIEAWQALYFKHDLTLSSWQSTLVESHNVYQDIFTRSAFTEYLQVLFKESKKALTMQDKIVLFSQYQLSNRLFPLFYQEQIWATDKQFNIEGIFSINAIPYWHLLTTSQNKH